MRAKQYIFYGELQEGKRFRSQKKHYKDTLKASLKDFIIPPESWEQTAQNQVALPRQSSDSMALTEPERLSASVLIVKRGHWVQMQESCLLQIFAADN